MINHLLDSDHPIGQFLSHILDLFILSLLWLLMTLTIVGFGPATAALYHSVVKAVRKDRDSAVRSFYYSLRENWKPSMIAGLICSVFIVSALMIDVPALLLPFTPQGGSCGIWTILAGSKLILLGGLILYTFPILSRFTIPVPGALIRAMGFFFRRPLHSVGLSVLLLVSVWLSIRLPLLIVILPALDTLIISFGIESALLELIPADFRSSHPNEDLWYLE